MDMPKKTDTTFALFSLEKVKALNGRIIERNGKQYVSCIVRKKEIRLTPEEFVRQLYLDKLMTEYGYGQELFTVDSEVTMGSSGKRADIVVYEKERPSQAYIIVEHSVVDRCVRTCDGCPCLLCRL